MSGAKNAGIGRATGGSDAGYWQVQRDVYFGAAASAPAGKAVVWTAAVAPPSNEVALAGSASAESFAGILVRDTAASADTEIITEGWVKAAVYPSPSAVAIKSKLEINTDVLGQATLALLRTVTASSSAQAAVKKAIAYASAAAASASSTVWVYVHPNRAVMT